MAQRIEEVLRLELENEKKERRFAATHASVSDCLDRPRQLCQLLLKHVLSGVQHSHAFNHVRLIADKAAVCKMAAAVIPPSLHRPLRQASPGPTRRSLPRRAGRRRHPSLT